MPNTLSAILIAISLALLLSGCNTNPQKPSKPAAKITKPAKVLKPGSPQIRAYRAPEKKVHTKAKPVRSAIMLMQRAEIQKRSGDFNGAARTLQRAIRIVPKNAALWHQLAKVRFAQKHYQLAGQLANKSNALAHKDRRLKAKNWHLIARTYQALGKTRKAAWAQQQAKRLQSRI